MVRDIGVVIDVHAHLAPLGIDEALGRQRPQDRLIEPLEEVQARQPALASHRPRVQIRQERTDARVQRRERQEGFVSEPGEHSALGHLHADCHFRIVARFRG